MGLLQCCASISRDFSSSWEVATEAFSLRPIATQASSCKWHLKFKLVPRRQKGPDILDCNKAAARLVECSTSTDDSSEGWHEIQVDRVTLQRWKPGTTKRVGASSCSSKAAAAVQRGPP